MKMIVANENEDITDRTIISEHNNKQIRNGTNSQFANKVSSECFIS